MRAIISNMIEENCSELNGLKVWKPKGLTVVHTKSLRIYFSKRLIKEFCLEHIDKTRIKYTPTTQVTNT